MSKFLSIDPGKSKCGLVLAEISKKKVYKAVIIKSESLEDYVRNLNSVEDISKIIIGNGTTSKEIKKKILLIEQSQDTSSFSQLAFSGFSFQGKFLFLIKILMQSQH